MFCVVVVLLGLNTRIRDMINFHLHAEIFSRFSHLDRYIHDGELLGELVVDATFASRRGIKTGELDAANGVPNIQKSSRLAALPVNRLRLADGRLHTKTI